MVLLSSSIGGRIHDFFIHIVPQVCVRATTHPSGLEYKKKKTHHKAGVCCETGDTRPPVFAYHFQEADELRTDAVVEWLSQLYPGGFIYCYVPPAVRPTEMCAGVVQRCSESYSETFTEN